MGKPKGKKGSASKHIQARIHHLHNVAKYLTRQAYTSKLEDSTPAHASDPTPPSSDMATSALANDVLHRWATEKPSSISVPSQIQGLGLSALYTTHLLSISRKMQIRLESDIKHSICKRCSASLLPGLTSTSLIENLSRGGGKPWADVKVVECNACGMGRRMPVGAKRQVKKGKSEGKKGKSEGAKAKRGELEVNAEQGRDCCDACER